MRSSLVDHVMRGGIFDHRGETRFPVGLTSFGVSCVKKDVPLVELRVNVCMMLDINTRLDG
jgi:hypothetical protein